MTRLVVMISGFGSNLQAIIDACAAKIVDADIAAVVSNRSQAFGLQRAQHASIPTIVIERKHEQSVEDYDRALAQAVAVYKPDLIVLAGFMRILSVHFLQKFPNKVINLHPALPGMFPGLHAIERAFAAFKGGLITETGIMIHKVPDEGVDCGPVITQTSVPIFDDDTLESLSSRMHNAEHRLLIETLATLVNHSWPTLCSQFMTNQD